MQLDKPIKKHPPTLRQALLSLMSTSDPKFPIFHSVDRSNYRESGICFQFLPELAEEARMTISNLVPLMKHKYGAAALNIFSPSAVKRMAGCQWDPHTGTVIGQYDDEINFLDEDDPMKSYMSTPTSAATTTTVTGTSLDTLAQQPTSATTASSLLPNINDDSVSILGNTTHHKWTPSPAITLLPPLTQRP